jgi:hypothetical protein
MFERKRKKEVYKCGVDNKITLRVMHLITIEEREKGIFCQKHKGVGC